MRTPFLLIGSLTLAACATTPSQLHQRAPLQVSGSIIKGIGGPGGLTVGLIADSQIQTRSNSRHVRVYRNKIADAMFNVAIRPPALDYASRALLWRQLENLKAGGAQAIFYLGDGANNGCGDEFLAGLDPRFPAARRDEEGLLKILDRFRSDNPSIPVFFVLGNHDFLGAGSTPNEHKRKQFCEPDASTPQVQNRALTKLEVMTAVDAFNRSNVDNWGYTSNFSAALPEYCGPAAHRQHARRGCYLAAVLNRRIDGLDTQIVLLDSNDWTNVRHAWFLGDQLGHWGGVSYAPGSPQSQIEWLEQQAANKVATRLIMSHFNVGAMLKKSWFGSLSHLSRHLPRLVSRYGIPHEARQGDAYFITAHTHTEFVDADGVSELRVPSCAERRCGPVQEVWTKELNVGSTTDYRNSSALLRIKPAATGKGSIEYQQLEADPEGECRALNGYITANSAAFGIIPGNEFDYVNNSHAENMQIWENIRTVSDANPTLEVCIGLYAAAVEEGRLDRDRVERRIEE